MAFQEETQLRFLKELEHALETAAWGSALSESMMY